MYMIFSHISVPAQMWTIYIALIEIAHLTTYTKWLLLYEWESQAFFPVGRGIWFEPRAAPFRSCDLLSVGDDAKI